MQILLVLFLGIVIGAGIALLSRTDTDSDMQFVGHLVGKKKENLKKLMEYFEKNDRVTNDDVEKLLGVSNTTAYRYLEDLEQCGNIRQVGRTGAGVYYEKISR